MSYFFISYPGHFLILGWLLWLIIQRTTTDADSMRPIKWLRDFEGDAPETLV